jgi:hypothetical protein
MHSQSINLVHHQSVYVPHALSLIRSMIHSRINIYDTYMYTLSVSLKPVPNACPMRLCHIHTHCDTYIYSHSESNKPGAPGICPPCTCAAYTGGVCATCTVNQYAQSINIVSLNSSLTHKYIRYIYLYSQCRCQICATGIISGSDTVSIYTYVYTLILM